MITTLLLAISIALRPINVGSNTLRFDPAQFVSRSGQVDGKKVAYRSVENVVYVTNPVDRKYQSLNVYAPEAYFSGRAVNGYDSDSAPIFFPNSIGGYMPGAAEAPGVGMDRMHNTLLRALARGYVVVAPGARGRTLKDNGGRYTGKAPAAIVDLKAAIRYVRFNAGRIPGNVERIISNGTSAGGAMSALLGASGNSRDYASYLKVLGAAEARDDIWVVSAYCPITNLENSDMAYEWLLNGVNESKRTGPSMPPLPDGPPPSEMGSSPFGRPNAQAGPMSAEQIAQSATLKALFSDYVNTLHLKGPDAKPLTLDKNGNGSFKEYVSSFVLKSAQVAQAKGTDVSNTPWLSITAGRVVGIDWPGYVRSVGRMKQTLAFDSLNLASGENNLFGSATVDNRHFTDFGAAHSKVTGAQRADPMVVKMMNPMSYLGAKGVKASPFWRIRHGAIDRDTSLAIAIILATSLRNRGIDVDVAIPWNTPHSGDYDLDELFAWIDTHAKTSRRVTRRVR